MPFCARELLQVCDCHFKTFRGLRPFLLDTVKIKLPRFLDHDFIRYSVNSLNRTRVCHVTIELSDAAYTEAVIGWMRCDISMASSVVSERRRPAAAAAAVPGSVVSGESSASSLSDAGVVSETCFVKPAVNNTCQMTLDQYLPNAIVSYNN